MPLIDKAYFTLEELRERWRLPQRDIVYLAENGLLRLSVRVFGLAIERSHFEAEPDGNWFEIPYERTRHVGLLDLLERDVFALFRDGSTLVSCFYHPDETIRLIEPTPYFEIRTSDVVVTREERDRVEAERLLRPIEGDTSASTRITFEPDGRSVRIGEEQLPLGPVQAEVIRLLRAAAASGVPWQEGKALLREAGATTMRLSDLFKRRPQWRRLIASDGRGRYRLIEH